MEDDKYNRSYDLKNAGTSPEPEDAQSRTDKTTSPKPAAAEVKPSGLTAVQPTSQAVMDMKEAGLGLDPGDISKNSRVAPDETTTLKKDKKNTTENMVCLSKLRWFVLLILSLAATSVWAIEAQYADRPYNLLAWGLLALTIILTIPTAKFLRLPTRGGLAALGWSCSFFITALFGPAVELFHIPAAMPWAVVLILVFFWVAVAICRKLGRYKIFGLVLSLFLIYATLSPLWFVVDNILAGGAWADFNFVTLSESPAFLTSMIPETWFLWPLALMIFGILPLAAIFALGDQCTALRCKGGRHGGNFFLALAFIGLIPYGFLSFNQAVAQQPGWASMLHSICPVAEAYIQQQRATTTVPAVQPPQAVPVPTEATTTSATVTAPATPAATAVSPEPSVEVEEVVLPAEVEEVVLPADAEEVVLPADAEKVKPSALQQTSPEGKKEPLDVQTQTPAPAVPSVKPEQPLPQQTTAPDSEILTPSTTATQTPTAVGTIEERLTVTEQELDQTREKLLELEKMVKELSGTIFPIAPLPTAPPYPQ